MTARDTIVEALATELDIVYADWKGWKEIASDALDRLYTAGHRIGPADMEAVEAARKAVEELANTPMSLSLSDWSRLSNTILSALDSPQMPVPAAGPVPTHECQFHVGQPVRLANPYAEEDPEAVFYVTGITWEHRMVRSRGWNIMIASKGDIEKGYGQTDGFAPDDLLASRPNGGA